jgi:membrane protease YdiL (CAAX protease family)
MQEFFRWVFVGSNGIRAGWRALIFVAIMAAIATGIRLGLHVFGIQPPKGGQELYPWMGIGEAISFLLLVFAAWVMSRIERRPLQAYGMPFRDVLRSRIWLGLLWGFAGITAVLLLIFAGRGFQIDGIATGGIALIVAVLLWTPTFLCVALSEEFMFRGYLQYTLTTGVGFWLAAIIMSALFGAAHLGNKGETPLGITTCVMFALFLCVTLRQTGNLWLAVGIHAGWDWGESFFYGVPDSGTTTWHPFLTTSFHGPVWLTGGSAGPEGSVFTVLALVAMTAIVLWRYPTPRYETRATLVPATGS